MKEEQIIDEYLKAHFSRDEKLPGVEPSDDFVKRTMMRVAIYEGRRQKILDGLVVMLAVSPIILRQAWLWARNDFFSVSPLPFGETIVRVYEFFLSAAALYGLVALALIVVASYAVRFRRVASAMAGARSIVS